MVVLLIMGFFVGPISNMTKPDDRAMLRLETERLAQLLNLAATESRHTGNSITWTAQGSGYRFWRFAADTDWSEILDDDSLRARTLPRGMKITDFRVENTEYQDKMRMELHSFGSTLSLTFEPFPGAAHRTVRGSPIGQVRVLPDEWKTNGETAQQ
jgi:general secretion pathway protein H